MKKLLLSLLAGVSVTGCTPAVASYDLQVEDHFTNGSMGCMMMRECTKEVKEVKSIKDVENYQKAKHPLIKKEFNDLVKALNDVGVNVYIAPQYYFLVGTRGVYYTAGNDVFLNAELTKRSTTLMYLLRHEGWHTAQDCMAGTLDNTFTALIHREEAVADWIRRGAERTYSKNVLPFEAEAMWAMYVENKTGEALRICASSKKMWEYYTPTPLTGEWLRKKGFM